MAIFGFGKKKEEEKKVVPKDTTVKSEKKPKKSKKEEKKVPLKTKVETSSSDLSGVIIRPRITEKSTLLSEGNVYTFDVHPDANKKEIEKAIVKNYKVKPIKVNVTDIKRKIIMSRGKKGVKAGGKKAMVHLKDGDKIEFV